jgi:acyl-CoA synthetase (AMP-forming)/AMP-acid ligase II
LPEIPDLGYAATFPTVLKRAAALWGDQDFIVMPDRRLTFAQAEADSRAIAKRMLRSGVGKGARVGLFDTFSTQWVSVWLAGLRIGALVMPFSSISRPAELAAVVRLGDVSVLWTRARLLGKSVESFLEDGFPGLAAADSEKGLFLSQAPYLRRVWVSEHARRPWADSLPTAADQFGDDGVSDEMLAAAENEVTPADLAQVTYTSGSSALPKGVVHTHGSIVRTTALGAKVQAASPANQNILCGFPFFWIGGTLVLGQALQSGAKVSVLEKFEAGPALDMIEREQIGVVRAWPSLIQSLKAHPTFADRDLSSIPSLRSGSSDTALSGSPVPGIPAHRGMSETVGNWQGADKKIIDPETGEAVLDMAEGELVVRGYGVTQGYYKQEREGTFDADGWLHTGDRCFLHENKAYFVGRYHEMIKVRGANVSPREVELLLEGFDEIEHALVFSLPGPTSEDEVCAAVTLKHGRTLAEGEILARAGRLLSSFKVPTRITIFEDASEIPWLASGKPDKRALAARLSQGSHASGVH